MKRINMTHLAVAAALAAPAAMWPAMADMGRLLKHNVTYPYWGGKPGGAAAGLYAHGNVRTPGLVNVVNVPLDFAAIAAARVAAGQAALGAADVLELIPVKTGTFVLLAGIEVTTVEGAAATVDLGDGASAAGYVSNADLNALTYVASLVTSAYSVAVGGGKLYTTDDTIDMVLDNASIDVAVCRVFAVTCDVRNYRG